MKRKIKKTIGVLDQGVGTKIIDCDFNNLDIGVKAEGKDLLAKDCDFNDTGELSEWYEVWWMKYIIFPVLVAVIGTIIAYIIGF